ncbi:hypothetical protein RJ639_026941 [Escallonia herrerae]|uniref:O-fucosyltransferase family protein n=1 Tax=Escallonia herrerae TaxID=1293975 RepID=A0AA89BFQ1_9ASTE|nr:hypothetical protein RJ639_026941 [Escallonia herrerae]
MPLSPPHFLSLLLSSTPLNSLLFSPKKTPRNYLLCSSQALPLFFLSLLVSFNFLAVSLLSFTPITPSRNPTPRSASSPAFSPLFSVSLSSTVSNDEPSLSSSAMLPLPPQGVVGNVSEVEREFWRQPDGEGYRPCLDFSIEYRRKSARVSKESRRFLLVVVSGGLINSGIRLLMRLSLPGFLKPLWLCLFCSEFSYIFDIEHFKKTLKADVRVVSSVPSTHLVSTQTIVNQIPFDVSPLWIRARFFKQLNEKGLLVLKGLDSKLSKNLPPDLQKLRCKVAFHALRFAAPIREIGYQIARRMWIEGPYVAIHLRLDKDVWLRTGCLTGLGPEYDNIIAQNREFHPQFITGRSNMRHVQRRLAGLCPLNAFEVARLLKGLGAPGNVRVYVAGGEPFGGALALQPLIAEFPNVVTKKMLARESELAPYSNRSSVLAAIDYIVALSSDVFLPSHGGNMGRAMKGHRAYVGHRKHINPNKRVMVPFFEEAMMNDTEFSSVMRKLHQFSLGQPELRTNKTNRDVIAYPLPECMCKH